MPRSHLPLPADDALRSRIAGRLQAFERHALNPPGAKRAAVALAIIEEGFGAVLPGMRAPTMWSTEAAVLLTRRALTLRNHPNQWALPGGSVDDGETQEQAALRELHEEVGLQLDASAILGRLDDFATRSGFAITPFVVWAGSARSLVPSEAEVASIHRIPVSEFMRADAPLLDPIEDSVHPVLRMPVGDTWIAAPTAAFLYQFREVCMAGRITRVAHYEQPLFARR
ncbi:NUDIX hydrolase [Variovorax sp. JS1663]|uniref:NUDIX hydrolase n=1 Tax=Variovorax sp. JS1663 TaxID=1851577 RepID=UPI000B349DE1|nr:CoA pyrophosphatase [Variovorax sp. JS1663]OUL98306.1 coenzyme A pyrophosphatase [Variovorax sp. JS1663]